MINTKRNNRLETYRGDTGILNVNVSGYNFVEGDYAILSVKKDLEDVEYIFQKRVDKFEDNLNTAMKASKQIVDESNAAEQKRQEEPGEQERF